MASKTRRNARITEKPKLKPEETLEGKLFRGLPAELLDAITDFVHSQRDLYHLAQSHSVFRDLALPYRLPYRHVRCMVDDWRMWNHLLEDPKRARAIRSMELGFRTLNEGNEVSRKPPLILVDVMMDPKPTIASVLSFLTGLVELRCREWDAPIPIWDEWFEDEVDIYDVGGGGANLWNLFKTKCPNIQLLEVTGQLQCSVCPETFNPFSLFGPLEPGVNGPSKVYDFTGLKSLLMDFRCLEESLAHPYDPTALANMLPALTDLVSLEIHWKSGYPIALPGMASFRYRRLQVLALTGVTWAEKSEDLIAFMANHPQLVRLSLGAGTYAPVPDKITGALPNVTHLECIDSLASAILLPPLPDDALRGIKILGVRHRIPEEGSFSIPSLVQVGYALNEVAVDVELGLASWVPWLNGLAKACPNVSRLRISADDGTFFLETTKKRSRWWTDPWIQALSQFPNLEVFTPPEDMGNAIFGSPEEVFFSAFSSSGDRNVTTRQEHSMGTFIAACPKLQFVCWRPLVAFSERTETYESDAAYDMPMTGNVGKKKYSIFRGLSDYQELKLVPSNEAKQIT